MSHSMPAQDVRRAFKTVYGDSTNFMTPTVLSYGKRGVYLYEISEGDWMESKLYGVTVIEITEEGLVKRPDLSRSFDSRLDAMSHARSLWRLNPLHLRQRRRG